MIKAMIIDDDMHGIEWMETLLSAHCSQSIHLLGSVNTVEEGERYINRLRPDLVFLDIQLRGKTGFDLLQQVHPAEFDIIFTSACEKYAIRAFKFSAIDYLLKPVDPFDLQQAVARLQEKRSNDDRRKKLESFFHGLKTLPGFSKRISIPTVNGLVFLPVNDIIRCESSINYTAIFLKDGRKLTVAKTLKEFEDMLGEYNFYRVHNSHLVNMSYIKSYNKGKSSFISMTDDSEIEISTRRKEDFLKKLAEL